jgi:hypothetical protein
MPTDRELERERLKEEYKDHFRKMRDTRERVKEAVGYQKISKALNDMNTDAVFDTMGEMVDSLKDKIALAEAKLEIALESYRDVETESEPAPADPEAVKKAEAKKAIQQIKMEMGMVYKDLEKEAEALREQQKTMGRAPQPPETAGTDATIPDASKKTIGRST